MWSVGCIIVYLISGKNLFPGRNKNDQLHLILSHRGATERMIQCDRRYEQYTRKTSLRKQLQKIQDPMGVTYECGGDLVEGLLQMDPKCRLTAEAALDHPFTYEYRNIIDDSKSDSYFPFQWQHDIHSVEDARRVAYNHVMGSSNQPLGGISPSISILAEVKVTKTQ